MSNSTLKRREERIKAAHTRQPKKSEDKKRKQKPKPGESPRPDQPFDEDQMANLKNDMKLALERVAKHHGIHFRLGTVRFDDNSMRVKLTGIYTGGDGDPEIANMLWFEKYAEDSGLKPEDYNREFKDEHGDIFIIKGLNRHASRYPVIGEEKETGELFKFDAETVNEGMIDKKDESTDKETEEEVAEASAEHDEEAVAADG